MDWIISHLSIILSSTAIAGILIIGVALWKLQKKIEKIFKGSDEYDENILQGIIRRINLAESTLEETEPRLRILESIADVSIQKVAFMRFNPFQDTGGDNSFVLVLLDKNNTGVIISSLYTREGVRTYGKAVEKGKVRHVLSDEEKKVLAEAMKKTIL